MKSKTLKTKLFTGMLATMLIAPTVLGATPLLDGTPFAPVVAYADQMGANFNWTINKDTGNHGSELSAKTQIVQTTDGKSITLYLYEQSIGTLTLRWGETGNISTFNGGQVPTTVGNHNILIGDLGEVGSTDTISVNIAVDEYVAPIEKPLAPTNVVISQDGSYISAVVPQNSYAIVLDASGNEIGFSANANDIELDRKLKQNETVSVISQDMSTSLKSDPTYVTYLQAAQEITMEVWYVDIDTTKPIAPMGTVTGQENTQVQVNAISVDGYELVTQTPQYVIAQDGTQVVFQYKKKDVKPVETYATLTTKFVDEKGTEISKATTQDFLVGGTYTATAKTVDGYTLVGQSQKTGTMTKDGATETFTYKKNEVKPPVEQKATLTTKYVDEKGNDIVTSEKEEVVVGKEYKAVAKDIEGYTLKGKSEKTGTMVKGGVTETFTYKKNEVKPPVEQKATLTTKFVDEKGKEIAKSTTEEVVVGKEYKALAKEIKGYDLVGQAEKTGTMSNDGATETFTYKEQPVKPIEKRASLNTKYVDDKGVEVAKAKTEEVIVGKTYVAKAVDVKGYTVRGTGTITGVMTEKGATEIFVYDKNEEPTNPVEKRVLTVKYLDVDTMKEIKAPKSSTHEKGDVVVVKADEIKDYTVMGETTKTVEMNDNQTVTFLYGRVNTPVERPENASNVKFIEGTKGSEISAVIPKGLTMMVEYDGEIVAESTKSGNIKLSKSVATGQEISYWTVDDKGLESEADSLTRTDKNEVEVNKSELEKLVSDTKKLDLNKFTTDSVTPVQVALVEAEDVLKDGSATQKDVDKAYENLDKAVKGLVEKGKEPVKPVDPTEPTKPTKPVTPNKPVSPTDDKEDNKGKEVTKEETKTEGKETSDVKTEENKKSEEKAKKDELKKSGKVEQNNFVGGLLASVLGLSALGFGIKKSRKDSK